MIGILLITHGSYGEALVQNACHVLNKRPPQLNQLGMSAQDDPLDLLPLAKLLLNEVDGNLVRTAAGYNGGPGNVMRWDSSLNASQDPLLYIASIPLHETRDFVQRVLTNYWMYQIRMGQPTPSLDQIASHDWPRYAPQDGRH